MKKKMTNAVQVLTNTASNPHSGLTIVSSSTVLWWLGFIGAHLAQIGILFGIAVSIYSLFAQIQKRREEKALFEAQMAALKSSSKQ